ncbi:MAG: hypothetical protein UR28_C0003G0007 [Candidatus Peregrinibacteria bacterium GW2011_GWF2_33_10]|nr:MAG: hypothetical protein UR28_C0003G0007 [Candidatus Peregrinibacteria bacterium GW2011_GWF2_33_10]
MGGKGDNAKGSKNNKPKLTAKQKQEKKKNKKKN